MHDANGFLTPQGWILLWTCGVALLGLTATTLAYLLVVAASEDRNAMDRVDSTIALFAPRTDDKERRDDAHAEGVVSAVRLELARDLHRRPTASLQRLRAEHREGRPFPPAA
jgi:hypothetical protein